MFQNFSTGIDNLSCKPKDNVPVIKDFEICMAHTENTANIQRTNL